MEVFMTRSMHDMWRFARKSGISMAQFGLLRRLYHQGDCEVHEVGHHFDVSPAAASQLVDKLVQAGLVARTENPDDRRARQVGLTAKGKAIVDRAADESYRWIDDLVAELSPENRAAAQASLAVLIGAEGRLPRRENEQTRDAIRASR
jgi:DNA-binding MarR family transcriptional regulator